MYSLLLNVKISSSGELLFLHLQFVYSLKKLKVAHPYYVYDYFEVRP